MSPPHETSGERFTPCGAMVAAPPWSEQTVKAVPLWKQTGPDG